MAWVQRSFVFCFAMASAMATITSFADAEDRIVLGGVEVCGPIDVAIEYLKPTNKRELKKWQKERNRSEDRSTIEFSHWNRDVPWEWIAGRKIVLMTSGNAVRRVVLFTSEGRSAFDAWMIRLQERYGDPSRSGGAEGGMVKYTWNRPNGISIQIVANAERTATALGFLCMTLEDREGKDIF